MFGIEPTQFDVRLVAFRIPIRVQPSFWLASILLSWNPDHPDLVFIWVMCLFVSILIHELGHALMAEAFQWPAEIVLYWCGGLTFSHRHHDRTPWREIAVSLAGPFAGFGVYWLIRLGIDHMPEGIELHRNVRVAIAYLIWINLYWGLVNLLPVWPLDGGQVCQAFLTWCRLRDPSRVTMSISVLVAGGAAYFFFTHWHSNFAGILFASLCLQNLASLQSPDTRL